MDMHGRGGKKNLGVNGGETIVRICCIKNLFSMKENCICVDVQIFFNFLTQNNLEKNKRL